MSDYELSGIGLVRRDVVDAGALRSDAEGQSLEASYFGLCAGTEDKVEGTKAFMEKRPPQFQGR